MKKIVLLISLIAICFAKKTDSDNLLKTAFTIVRDCGDKSIILCLKERALHYIDNQNDDIKITESIQFIKNDDVQTGRSLNDINLPAEPEARENEIDSLLVDRFGRFLGSHTLQFKLPKDTVDDMQRSLDEARGKKKQKKLLLPLLLLLKLKAAALLPLIIGFLALIAVKALIIGKLALIISAVMGLKKLMDTKSSHQNYEVVAHPHYSHGSGYEEHGHYARSIDAQNLAYSAYKTK